MRFSACGPNASVALGFLGSMLSFRSTAWTAHLSGSPGESTTILSSSVLSSDKVDILRFSVL